MYKYIVPFVVVLTTLFLAGCRRVERPADMPKLYPCEVAVLSEGKPLAGAKVSFHKKDPDFKWGIGGFTDESGKAVMVTHGQYHGVPEGEYLVAISKQERDRIETPAGDPDRVVKIPRNAMLNVYTWVAPVYAEPETTTLTATEAASGAKIVFANSVTWSAPIFWWKLLLV